MAHPVRGYQIYELDGLGLVTAGCVPRWLDQWRWQWPWAGVYITAFIYINRDNWIRS